MLLYNNSPSGQLHLGDRLSQAPFMQMFPVHINRVSKVMATSRCDACVSFQCVKAKTFDEERLLGPARPQARSSVHAAAQSCKSVLAAVWKRDRLCREHRGYGVSAYAQTAPAFSQTLEKSKPAKQIFLYFREQQPLHLSAMCWWCSRGINARPSMAIQASHQLRHLSSCRKAHGQTFPDSSSQY